VIIKSYQYLFLSIILLMLSSCSKHKSPSKDYKAALPDGRYSFGLKTCSDGKQIEVVEETFEFAKEVYANLLLFPNTRTSIVVKHPQLKMKVETSGCRVEVLQKIRYNQATRFELEPWQTARWTPKGCHFSGKVEGKGFRWGEENLAPADTFASRTPIKGKDLIASAGEFYPNLLPWDIPIVISKDLKGNFKLTFYYKEVVAKANKKAEEENDTFEEFGRYLFGCPLSQEGFSLQLIPSK
jgi:hypothetical protein